MQQGGRRGGSMIGICPTSVRQGLSGLWFIPRRTWAVLGAVLFLSECSLCCLFSLCWSHSNAGYIGSAERDNDVQVRRFGSQLIDLASRLRGNEVTEITRQILKVNSSKVAIAVVDSWNYHWCMTASERVSAMAPRLNRALECARKLSMPVVWLPSDSVGSYGGYLQREKVQAVLLVPVPKGKQLQVNFTARRDKCMCGPGISCVVNYGHETINPGFHIGSEDLIVSSTEEMYSVLLERSIKHVIYTGLHTNKCLLRKPGALRSMINAGLCCFVARDVNDAFSAYVPGSSYTPDQGTSESNDDLERAGVPTINLLETFRNAGIWDDSWVVEMVRIVPWGKLDRPFCFEGNLTIMLTTPWLDDVEIRYTVDGTAPTPQSALYAHFLQIDATTALRVAAFRGGARVSLESEAYYARLPAVPPKPDVFLDTLPMIQDYFPQSAVPFFWLPRKNKSFDGERLRVRNNIYERGLGMRAPSNAVFALRPEFERFVAFVGIADNILDVQYGARVAAYPSVVFRVFVDGELAAESPVMRISQVPWRFDVPIARGARIISLAVTDAGSRDLLDLGNWVDAGFRLRPEAQHPEM